MAETSIFEVIRQTHEETERYQQALVDILLQASSASSTTHKQKLRQSHKASQLLDRISDRFSSLHQLYKDPLSERANELEKLTGATTRDSVTHSAEQGDDQADALKEFYGRLDRINEYHQKYPQALPDAFSLDFLSFQDADPSTTTSPNEVRGLDLIDKMFSGEEMAGRFLDLYLHHDAFLNLKGGVKKISYLQYIDSFDKLVGPESKVPAETKRTEAYRKYLVNLRQYLSEFLRKTQPLSDIDSIESRALATFGSEWEENRLVGWEDQGDEIFGRGKAKNRDNAAPSENPPSQGEGIWCQACRKMYSKQTVYDAHLKSPKHQKAAAKLAASGGGSAAEQNGSGSHENGDGAAAAENRSKVAEVERAKRISKSKSLAREEVLVMALGKELGTLRSETKSNVERKAALTDRERQAEAEAMEEELNNMKASSGGAGTLSGEAGENEDEDEENDKIYNPLRLPLGWDGKPIPYWLYKLHGLGVEYKCEICSDYVYQGRKNFEKHFQESRHAFGMRALGLPNTVQFRDVTRIQDALALAEKLKRQTKTSQEETGDAEEVEDEQGNTYTRKTYELLKRQGLI
ncbi:hypothetical protein IE53DRAFT_405134 [Violaceomyces palustris]|uniref:Uncharacterized protein n=1 Tax=Violaceomyces palustris TaxID=1673888 RepID=A0ACD0P348_9BASI|nr:hypothetical protein IE53DRAFT_405134 [Violaceomyces palustris]